MLLLHHGTTRQRAEAIVRNGPDPDFREKNQQCPSEGFSTAPAFGTFGFGEPGKCAMRKANLFSKEGGPVILEFELPDELAREIVGDLRKPWESGKASNFGDELNFAVGFGIERLLLAWPGLTKRILDV